MGYGTDGLTFNVLREANKKRLPEFKDKHGRIAHAKPDGSDWTPAQWLQAVVGELGEYANERKKFERGDLTFDEFKLKAAEELADVATYLDLLARRCLDAPEPHGVNRFGVDLGQAIVEKFNRVSERVKSKVRIYADGSDWHFHLGPEPQIPLCKNCSNPLIRDSEPVGDGFYCSVICARLHEGSERAKIATDEKIAADNSNQTKPNNSDDKNPPEGDEVSENADMVDAVSFAMKNSFRGSEDKHLCLKDAVDKVAAEFQKKHIASMRDAGTLAPDSAALRICTNCGASFEGPARIDSENIFCGVECEMAFIGRARIKGKINAAAGASRKTEAERAELREVASEAGKKIDEIIRSAQAVRMAYKETGCDRLDLVNAAVKRLVKAFDDEA
jgi:NTP pyrophosphatase (non-canonical NTP hydrolase)